MKSTVFVGNLGFFIDEIKLKEEFLKYGEI